MSAAEQSARQAGAHEKSDISARPVIIGGIVIGLILIVAACVVLAFFDCFAAREARLSPPANPLAAAAGPRMPPAPRLQAQPIEDLRELRAAEDNLLYHYGWVDKSAGVVRIPITRAIDIVAARGGGGAAAGAPAQ